LFFDWSEPGFFLFGKLRQYLTLCSVDDVSLPI